MDIIVEENQRETQQLEEMTVTVLDSLPTAVENSVFYPKLKQLLHVEINRFCRDKQELKDDLNIFRQLIGEAMTEEQIREYLDNLKAKYNNLNTNVGIQYHLEFTRIDIACIVFIVIKRKDIEMKKFVFRFRKADGINASISGLTPGGLFELE